MFRSAIKAIIGVVLLILGVGLGRPLASMIDVSADPINGLLINGVVLILILLGLVMTVVGVIQFCLRTVRNLAWLSRAFLGQNKPRRALD